MQFLLLLIGIGHGRYVFYHIVFGLSFNLRTSQAWPLPPAYCAIVGYVFGLCGSLLVSTTMFFAETDATMATSKSPSTKSGRQSERKTKSRTS